MTVNSLSTLPASDAIKPKRRRRAFGVTAIVAAVALFTGFGASQAALAAEGVANSEVTWSEDGTTFAAVPADGDDTVPWSVTNTNFSPGSKPLVASVKMRTETASDERVSFIVMVDPTRFDSTTSNGKDLTFVASIDGEKLPAVRAQDLFASQPVYDGDSKLRLITVADRLEGPIGSVHDLTMEVSLPQESGNESQNVRFGVNAIAVPLAPLPTATPTETATPVPTTTVAPEPTESSQSDGLAETGADGSTPSILLAGIALTVLGAGVVMARSRRRTDS